MSIDSKILDVAQDLVSQYAEGLEFRPDEMWLWPRRWSLEDKMAFRDMVCQHEGWDIRDNPVLDGNGESIFTCGTVSRFTQAFLDRMADKIEEGMVEVEVVADSNRIIEIALAAAQMEHEVRAQEEGSSHEGFFDECDHADCVIFRRD